jgi:hypothetical protein
MIVEWFADMALGLVVFATSLLPDIEVAIPDLTPVFGFMLTFDAIVPIGTMLQAALAVGAVTGLMFVLKVIQTLVSHVPGIGGGGA